MDIEKLIQNAHLMKAVRNGDLLEVNKLLNAGADVNFVYFQSKSQTPLHDAVETGNLEMAKLLLSKGAYSEMKNVDNKKPKDLCTLLDDKLKQAIDAVFKEYLKKCQYKKSGYKRPSADVSSVGTYMKRPGTAAVGQLYETKLLTMVLFRLLHNDQVESFRLGNNLDEAGAFDDIVLKTCIRGKTRVQCLQAKHREAASVVNFSDLVNMEHAKGDFHLAKYFDSYLKIRYMFNPASEHEIFQGEYEQTEMELIIFTPALLNFPEKVHSEYTTTYNTFRTSKHGKTVKIKCTQVLRENFVKCSQEWHRKAIAEILLRLIWLQNYNTSNLKEAIEQLQRNNVLKMYKIDNYNSSGILQLCNNQKFLKSRFDKTKFDETCKILKDTLLPSVDDHVGLVKDFFKKLRFYTEQATENELEEIVRRDIKTRHHESDDIIFAKALSSVEKWWKIIGPVKYLTKDCKIFETVEDEVQLEKLHTISLNKIKSNIVKFRSDKVSNSNWVNLSEQIKEDKKVCMMITSSTPELSCLKLMQNLKLHEVRYKFLIADDTQNANILNVLLKVKPQCPILVYLPENDCAMIDEIRPLVNQLIIISKQEYRGEWTLITDETEGLLDLDLKCQEKLLESLVLFQGLSVPLGTLIDKAPRDFIDAKTLQKLVNSERIIISNTDCYMDQKEFIESDYIDRILLDNRQTQQIPKTISNIRERLVIVAAEPGMGKSTLLTGLAAAIKKSSPSSWIVRINLMNYSKQFSEWDKIRTGLDRNEAMSLLLKAMSFENGQMDSFERNLFRWYCKQFKVILLIDGFDEISPDYTTTVLQLLNIYKENFTAKLWVTTRTGGVQKELERSLMMTAYSLKPFTEEQAKLFLWNFWKSKLSLGSDKRKLFEEYVKQLLLHLSQSIDNGELELISVPLQIKMIAMVFQSDFEHFYNATNGQTMFEKLDLVSLYEKFIDLKFNVILLEEKNNIDITIPNIKQQSQESFNQFQNKHKQAAVYALFNKTAAEKILSETEAETVQDFLKEIRNSVEMTGIITRVVEGKPVFVHQTYAEFFAAQFIWEKYSLIPEKDFKLFLENISINNLIKDEQAQFVKFLQEIAQKRISECSNVSIKTSILLSTLLDATPESRQSFKSRALSFLLGIVECSIAYYSDCLIRLKILINAKQGNQTAKLLLKASECGYIGLLRLMTDSNADKINVTFEWLDDWTVLHFAVNGGHINIVEHLLNTPVKVNSTTKKNGQTALHMAIEKKYCNIVQLLLDNGSDVNICMRHAGITPLHLAAQGGSVEIVSMLLTKMPDINCVTTDDGETALHKSCGNGNLNIVHLLIEYGADVNIDSTKNGSTPLHTATRNNYPMIVQALLLNGANPNVGTKDLGFTALHWAARENLIEIARLLLNKGASVDIPAKIYGQTPLHIAVMYEHADVVELLLDSGANVKAGTADEGLTPLQLAARSNFCKIVEMLLEKGADIDSTATKEGGTPLLLAVENGQLEMVQRLIGRGADVDIADKSAGWTALHLAARNNFMEIAYILLENGANIDSGTNDDGSTALDVAIRKNNLDVARLLLDKGAKISNTEWTPLHVAAAGGFHELVKLLLEKGADIESKWSDADRTPIFEACIHKHVNVVKVLLSKGANFNLGIRNKGYTPLHISAQKNSPDIIQLLVEHGANINCTTSEDDRTPLYEAAAYNNVNAAKMLLELGADVNIGLNDIAFLPLHGAAQKDCPEIIKLLVSKSADIDSTTADNGRTPLFEAVSSKAINAVKMLLDLGADVHLGTTDSGHTPIHCAAHLDCPEIIKMLIDSGAKIDCTTKQGLTPLSEASRKAAVNAVKTLLELGASVEAGFGDHKPLHCAAHIDCPEIIQILINAGADINCPTTNNGQTPLYMACQFKAVNAAKMLLDLGADVYLSTISSGLKPLHIAAINDFPEIIKLLVEHGTNIDCTSTKHSRTPLLSASENRSTNAVKMLLKLGANIHLGITEHAFTPLHAAAEVNSSQIVQLLIENGAQINCTTSGTGHTPLFIAAYYNAILSGKTLLDLGANVYLGDSNCSYTPLHLAARNDSPEFILMLVNHGANLDCTTTDNGRTLLYEAARYSALSSVQMLLDMGANVHLGTTDTNHTPLHWAAQNDKPVIIELLVKSGANVDSATSDIRRTSLYQAARNNAKNAVKILLDLGANANIGDTEDGYTPLHWAAQKDNPEIIKLLIDYGANANCTTTDNGRTPLYVASRHRAVNAAKTLLDLGANANIGNTNGFTPLHWAAEKDNPEIIKMLIDYGANVNCITKNNGRTPLYQAAKTGAKNAVQILLELGANVNLGTFISSYTPIHLASANDHYEVIKLIIKNGAFIDCVTDDGRTPLYEAAREGSTKAVEVLLDLGANVNLSLIDNYTPLHWAARNGTPRMLEILLQAGTNVDSVTADDGRTPLYEALAYGQTSTDHLDVVRQLLEKGANVNAKSLLSGCTPLQYAAMNGSSEMVELLLEWGASLTDSRDLKYSPFYEACRRNHVVIVKLLLEKGFDAVSQKQADDYTPLHCAASYNAVKVVELLCKSGVDVNVRTLDEGITPLHEAAKWGYFQVAKVLLQHGADIDIETRNSKSTALSLAVEGGYKELIELLLAHVTNSLVETNQNIEDTSLLSGS